MADVILVVEQVEFKRRKNSQWEDGLLVSGDKQQPIIDMQGKLVPSPLWSWRESYRTRVEIIGRRMMPVKIGAKK